MSDFTRYCVCPACRGALEQPESARLRCFACGKDYPVLDGVALLLPEYAEEVRRRYLANYDRIARDDLAKPIVADRARLLHDVLYDFIGPVTGRAILDIGSAHGAYLRRLAAGPKVAIDLSLDYLKAIPQDAGIVRVCGDAEFLPVRPELFDVVILSDVLEHLLHAEALATLLTQWCRPEARLIVHVPWEESLDAYRDSPYEFVHLRKFGPYSLRALFHDFSVIRERSSLPALVDPVTFRLEPFLPRWAFNLLARLYFWTDLKLAEYARRERWIRELPRREWWLLYLYPPQVKMFELRRFRRTGWSQWAEGMVGNWMRPAPRAAAPDRSVGGGGR